MSVLSDYMSLAEAARELGVGVRTLHNWWAERRGPPRTKVGHRVYYRRDAVRAWLESQEHVPVRSGLPGAAGGRSAPRAA